MQTAKVNFPFKSSAVKAQYVLFASKPYLRKMLVLLFNSNISLYIKKEFVEKLCKVPEMELKTYNTVGRKFVFDKIYIIFKKISFTNTQGLVKIKLVYSKVLLLINYFDCRWWNTFKNTFLWLYKRQQIFFYERGEISLFYKCGSNKCSFWTKLFIKWSRYNTGRAYLT